MKTLLLVDGSSYLYRAFYAMTHLSAPDGTPTNAVYGVLNMLRRLRLEQPADYCTVVFDAKGKNFRHDLFADYKATRPPMPDDLRPQADMLPDLVDLMGWKVLKINGVEADDVIGTLAVQAAEDGMKVIISTGDKDMAQLVNEQITLVNTMKNETLDVDGVVQKFGVKPEQIRDFLTLMGDKVDNIEGVEKCGEKTAAKWLAEYGSLAEIMRRADEFKGKIGENLRAALPRLPLSYQLVTLKTDLDLSTQLPNGIQDLSRQTPDWHALIPRFQELGFKTWLKEAQNQAASNQSADLFDHHTHSATIFRQPESIKILDDSPKIVHYQSITRPEQLTDVVKRLQSCCQIALDTETNSLDPMLAKLVGISIAFAAGDAVYIPLNHSFIEQQLNIDDVLEALKPFLENPKFAKIGQNLKYDQHVFKNHGIDLAGIAGDAMLASYIVESHLGHGLDELAMRWLNLETITYESLCGKGAKQISFADVGIAEATQYACQDADFAWRIEQHLRKQMNAQQLDIYLNMELPIAQVLFQMERVGVHIDRVELAKQSAQLGEKLLSLETQIFELAGQVFNLNSPKQLQEIMFDKLGIPTKGVKKTATGGYSTDESVLEKLAVDYPLPKLIIQSRGIAKLKSTYTDKLPEMINAQTGRVHTNYAQAVTITGRLASNHPNLQNIPIRTAEGRKVRRAFDAPDGYMIVSADYSQVELRIMAHLSGDATLINAFKNGEDVHRRTAAEVFGMPPEKITAEQRRYAKTINFGLIYGMSEYGLAKALGIDGVSAKMFIQRYFERYVGVAEYMNHTKQQAAQYGYVETLFGRKLYLPDIQAHHAIKRAAAERTAINAPMQGTASDLIKKAMIDVSKFLMNEHLHSRLVMQVHDELVLEVRETELSIVKQKLPELMQQVGVGVLDVPLLAEVGVGKNWDDAH